MKIFDVSAEELSNKLAEELSSKMKQPEWSLFVKTGTSRQRPPEQKNWYFIRSGTILKRIYINGPVGVERLRSYFGSSKNLGHQPSHFKKAGGKIIRSIIQELEKLGYIEVAKNKKGRVTTKAGREFVNKVVDSIQSA
ncbi:40S ribosomal protein S19 [Candidatus Aenigmatarchaeota archaeon]